VTAPSRLLIVHFAAIMHLAAFGQRLVTSVL
jgi:hypothetical protein